jgi:cytochrome c
VKTAIQVTAAALFLGALMACGGGTPPPATPSTPAAGADSAGLSPTATFAEQAAAGAKLYGAKCAECHGANGEGGDGPRVVGMAQGALPLNPPATAKHRSAQFHTAADVAGFVVKNMPGDAPGSLSEPQYWAILAFDLKANGVDLGTKHLDGSTAAAVVIHP